MHTTRTNIGPQRRASKLWSALLGAGLVLAACSDGETTTSSAAETEVAESTTVSEQNPDTAEQTSSGGDALTSSDPSSPANQSSFDVTGEWIDNFGRLQLSQDGTTVSGTYEGGTIEGTLSGTTLTGFFFEGGTRACDTRNGTTEWGDLVWDFSEDGTSFTGDWSWCDETERSEWSGSAASSFVTSTAEALPISTTYFDLTWTLNDASISAVEPGTSQDDDLDIDWISVDVTIANFTEDLGFSGMGHADVLRLLVEGETFPIEQTRVLAADGSTLSSRLSSSPLSEEDRTWVFEIPAGTQLSDISVQLGLNEDHKVVVPLTGPGPEDPEAPVNFSITEFGGDYSFNAVDFVLSGGHASLNRGVYESGNVRPGGLDRRADEGLVFVNFDLQATQFSTSPVSGVNPGAHVLVDQAGVTHACDIDAPGLYGEETITYGVSCPVPINSTNLTLVMSSGKCAGGCISEDHRIEVDASFLAMFG